MFRKFEGLKFRQFVATICQIASFSAKDVCSPNKKCKDPISKRVKNYRILKDYILEVFPKTSLTSVVSRVYSHALRDLPSEINIEHIYTVHFTRAVKLNHILRKSLVIGAKHIWSSLWIPYLATITKYGNIYSKFGTKYLIKQNLHSHTVSSN